MKKFFTLFLGCTTLLMAQFAYSQEDSMGSVRPAQRINWLQNYSDAVAQSQASSKPILILFTGTNWCPACMNLERNVITQPEFAQAVGSKFIFLKAEFPEYGADCVAASPYKPLLDRYGINAFPTLVIIKANGQKLYTVNYRQGNAHAYAQELLQKLNPQATNQ